MATIFPPNPQIGDQFQDWEWDGRAWNIIAVDLSAAEYATETELSQHAQTTLSVHGIANTADLETQSGAQSKANAAQSAAESYADSLSINYDPAGSAAQAVITANAYADSLAVNYDPAGSAAQAQAAAVSSANSYTDGQVASVNIDVQAAVNDIKITEINAQSSSYIIQLSDIGKIVEMSGGGTLTVPLDSTTDFPVGSTVAVMQTGTSQVTVAGASGVTVNSSSSLTLNRWEMVRLVKRAANNWTLQVGGGGNPKAVVSTSTASSIVDVTINGVGYKIYKFTGSGSITFSSPGFVDVLLQGGGGTGNNVDAAGGAGGGGGQVEKSNVYVSASQVPVRVGSGAGTYLAMSHPTGTSEFNGIAAVGGAPASQYRDRMCGGGACGASFANAAIGAASLGMYYQGRIGAEMRGGNSQGNANGRGGGVGGDGNTGNGYNPGLATWGHNVELGGGGNSGKTQAANTGNGGNNGGNGNSGIVLIRVKN